MDGEPKLPRKRIAVRAVESKLINGGRDVLSPNFFSKLKALLRKAAERTVPKLWRRIRALLRTISDEECLNFFRHAGYASI